MGDCKVRHDVYEYSSSNGSFKALFSDCVKREFGENKVVFIDGDCLVCTVQPLRSKESLKLAGHTFS